MSTVLVIDDSPAIRRATTLLLSTSPMVDRVLEAKDGLVGLKLMASESPDLVLCDLEMPLCDGARFLALKATRADMSHVPVIMLTSEPDPERKAVLFDAGASDYVTKPFHARELLARVESHLRICRMQEELREKNRHLEELAVTDPLTGLGNRRAFDTALAREVARAVRYDLALTLVMIDLDHFKRVNDEHGHLAGDRVLAGVGAVVRKMLRGTDIPARYGGEEIAILLPHTGIPPAATLGERLRAAIGAASFEGTTARVTASVGLAQIGDLTEKTGVALVGAADAAVYAAKAAGRDRVLVLGRPPSGVLSRADIPLPARTKTP